MQDIFLQRLALAHSQGFSLLRRFPSTTVWRTLSYVQTLCDEERSHFFDSCAEIACQNHEINSGMIPPPAVAVGAAANELPQARLFRQIFSEPRFSGYPDRFMRQFAVTPDALSQMVDEARIPAIIASQTPVVAKAGPIRKALHPRLNQEFDAETSKLGGGEWLSTGVVDDVPFQLCIDYGGMGPGFRYGVGFGPDSANSARALRSTLESSYGFPSGVCDFPLADELDQLADTICEIIIDLSRLYREVLACGDA